MIRGVAARRWACVFSALALCGCGRTELTDPLAHCTGALSGLVPGCAGTAGSGGAAPPDCAPGFSRCDFECVDLQVNDRHCAACGAACPAPLRCVLGSCSNAGAGWATLAHDMQRTGVSTEETGVPPLSLAWERAFSGAEVQPVVVERGRVIVNEPPTTSEHGAIVALRADDGEELWSYGFGNLLRSGQTTIVDGRIYVQYPRTIENPATIQSIDAASGRRVWLTEFDSQWPSERYWAPAVGPATVYANGGMFGGLYGFDRATGKTVFFSDALEQYDEWAPSIAPGGVLTLMEGNLRTHDAAAGHVLSTISIPWVQSNELRTTVPVRDGIAYVLAPTALYAYRLSDAALIWRANVISRLYPAVSETHVFALSSGRLRARRRSTGDHAWTFAGVEGLVYPPIVAAGYVYVAGQANVYAVDAESGEQVWSGERGGWLSIGAGMLFVATQRGVLTAYALTRR